MIKKILQRLLQFIFVLSCVSFFAFSLTYLAPGDPAQMVLNLEGDGASQEVLEATREEMGLNDPFLVQYGRWLNNLLHGDLGISYKTGHLVAEELAGKTLNTIYLAAASFVVLVLIAFPLGICSAVFHNRFADRLISFITFFGVAMPNFWLAILLMQLFSIKLNLLPIVGQVSVIGIIMPVATISIPLICLYAKQIRTAILEEMGEEYVTGLKARGIPKKTIFFRNVIPNAMTSIITLLGLSAGTLLAGTVIVEEIFGWPGLGKYALDAIAYRDYPVIQAYVVEITFVYVLINLVVDIIIYFQNPRERLGGRI